MIRRRPPRAIAMSSLRNALCVLTLFLGALFITRYADTFSTWRYREAGEALAGGEGTVFDATLNAFSHPMPGLGREQALTFLQGNTVFNQVWVSSPSATTTRDGLGPLFNARSCGGCHFKDGRGRPPADSGEQGTGLIIRVNLPDGSAPATTGPQLHDQAIEGMTPEGKIRIRYESVSGRYADGTPYALHVPQYEIELSSGALPTEAQLSPRIANQIMGLGLLEAVPESAVLAHADPEDLNGDGISGRPHLVASAEHGSTALGRFGWKAGQATVREQIAAAFQADLGITSTLFPESNCAERQLECLAAPTGGDPELAEEDLDAVLLYVRSLAVPGRRAWNDPTVLRGKGLFRDAQCAGCHVPSMQTGGAAVIGLAANQTIRPYTDLLLHDMGEGLGDGAPEGDASAREWRTPPLWGIGLIETVNGHTRYLHDGRAGTLEEAILWHGGEAEASRDAFLTMTRSEREALIAFLKSL